MISPETAPEPRPPVQPTPFLEEEPDLGPLPDYVVDPEQPRRAAPVAVPDPTPAPTMQEPEIYEPPPPEPEDPLAGLGLKPVTEFPTLESHPDREATHPRRRSAAHQDVKAERRSEGEPGDEPEEVGWMQGLSNRLSAYSLDTEDDAPEPAKIEVEQPDEPGPDDPART